MNDIPAWKIRLHSWMHLIRFLAVGGLNTLFGYCLFAFLTWIGFSISVAIALGMVIGIAFNFITYGKLAFSRKLEGQSFILFVLNYLIFYAINVELLHVFINRLHLSVYLAQLLFVPLLALGQFLSLRFIVFRIRG